MRESQWPAAVLTGIAAAGLAVALVTAPVVTVAALLGIGFVVAAALVPADRVVSVFGGASVVVAVLAPAQFLPPTLRMAELGFFAASAMVIVTRRQLRAVVKLPLLLVAAYLLVTTLATLRTPVPGAGAALFTHAAIGVLFLLFGCAAGGPERRRLTAALIVLAVAQAFYAVFETVTNAAPLWAGAAVDVSEGPPTRLASELIPGLLRAQGTLGHPLPLALLLLVAIGLVLRYPFARRWARPVLLVALFTGVAVSGSRSALVVGVLLLLFAPGRDRWVAAARGVYLAAVSVAVAAVSGLLTTDSGVGQAFSESGSFTHRAGALAAIERLLTRQDDVTVLIGNGWRSAQRVFDSGLLQQDRFFAVDNQWVTLLVTAGLAGVAVFAALTVVTIVRAGADLRPAVVALFATFFVYDLLLWPGSWALLALFIGLAARAGRPAPITPELAGQRVTAGREPAPR